MWLKTTNFGQIFDLVDKVLSQIINLDDLANLDYPRQEI